MSGKAVLVLCAQVLLVQTAFSQYLGRGIGCAERIVTPCGVAGADWVNGGLGYNGVTGAGLGLAGNSLAYGGAYDGAYSLAGITNAPGIAPASGGALSISSASPFPPTGISVASENAIEGILAVTGNLPMLSTVAWEAALPNAGAGSVAYGCGNGNIGIISEGVAAGAALADGLVYGNDLVYGNGLAYGNDLVYGNGLVGFGGIAAPTFGGCGCGAVY